MMEPLLDPEERDLEQSLMSAGRDIHMSHRLQAQTLTALGLGAVGLTATATAQAGSVVWFKSKVGVMLLSIGGAMSAVGAGYLLADQDDLTDGSNLAPSAASQPEKSPSSPAPAQADADDTASQEALDDAASPQADMSEQGSPSEAPHAAPIAKNASPDAKKPAQAKTTLTDELDHITRATAALNGGQAQVALQILSDYQKRFPRPQLGLEVEVLRIEALAKSGNQAEAQSRANRFVARYPNSALVARVKRILR